MSEWNEISIKFEWLRWKNRWWNGALAQWTVEKSVILYGLGTEGSTKSLSKPANYILANFIEKSFIFKSLLSYCSYHIKTYKNIYIYMYIYHMKQRLGECIVLFIRFGILVKFTIINLYQQNMRKSSHRLCVMSYFLVRNVLIHLLVLFRAMIRTTLNSMIQCLRLIPVNFAWIW